MERFLIQRDIWERFHTLGEISHIEREIWERFHTLGEISHRERERDLRAILNRERER